MALTLFRRILVPHDFSSHATRALKVAAELARDHNGRLVVLHAIAPFYPVTDFPTAEAAAWMPPADLASHEQKRLQKEVTRVVGADGPPADVRVEIGDPYQRIMDAARRADLIVMATAGRTGLVHLLVGSVAEKVVRHSPIPVLTFRPGTVRAAAKPAGAKGRRTTNG